jgi:hypothetical protein
MFNLLQLLIFYMCSLVVKNAQFLPIGAREIQTAIYGREKRSISTTQTAIPTHLKTQKLLQVCKQVVT